jgi:hypothetical protein
MEPARRLRVRQQVNFFRISLGGIERGIPQRPHRLYTSEGPGCVADLGKDCPKE